MHAQSLLRSTAPLHSKLDRDERVFRASDVPSMPHVNVHESFYQVGQHMSASFCLPLLELILTSSCCTAHTRGGGAASRAEARAARARPDPAHTGIACIEFIRL